jgi:hypothetical protein
MKLNELDVDDIIGALRTERSKWINVAEQEKRRHTESEKTTMCLLAAIEHVLVDAQSRSERH